AILMIALSAGFFGVVFGNRFGVQSPDAEAVLLLSSILCILSLLITRAMTEIRQAVAREKRRRGELGFDDMLSRLDEALSSENGEAL
ncbi:hypothetical protein QUG45_25705, partial [Enterobacter hormaechei]|nr:hypothetical protein [Enterobacter hormaechei]